MLCQNHRPKHQQLLAMVGVVADVAEAVVGVVEGVEEEDNLARQTNGEPYTLSWDLERDTFCLISFDLLGKCYLGTKSSPDSLRNLFISL